MLMQSLIVVLAIASPQASGPVAQPRKVTDVGKLLGKSRTEIEKALGKPVKSEDVNGFDCLVFNAPDTKGIAAFFAARGEGLSKEILAFIEVSFDEKVKWQSAAETLGMKPAKLKPTPLSNIPQLMQLVGEPYKGWNVYFSRSKAKYPGGEEFINTNGGLPMIQYEARSINDDAPD